MEGEREGGLKPQFFPDQLTSWLGHPPRHRGPRGRDPFPAHHRRRRPRLVALVRGVQDGDFFDASTEDRYADAFGLLPEAGDHTALRQHLADLPHQGSR
ncbi:hypothetical protein ACI2LO_29765 [Streptomyces sp. NPDC033754]|uniref:hypothetical protein n=1 Tax=unclassified Streptomyces TaxID=2593676 RepID=UPI0033CC7A40